jgi:hypothetical protein
MSSLVVLLILPFNKGCRGHDRMVHTIGSATFQLGIELGLNISTLESIDREYKDLTNQTRAVLDKWKSEKCSSNCTFETLAKSPLVIMLST